MMDFPKHIDRIGMELPILYFKGAQVKIYMKYDAFLLLKDLFLAL